MARTSVAKRTIKAILAAAGLSMTVVSEPVHAEGQPSNVEDLSDIFPAFERRLIEDGKPINRFSYSTQGCELVGRRHALGGPGLEFQMETRVNLGKNQDFSIIVDESEPESFEPEIVITINSLMKITRRYPTWRFDPKHQMPKWHNGFELIVEDQSRLDLQKKIDRLSVAIEACTKIKPRQIWG